MQTLALKAPFHSFFGIRVPRRLCSVACRLAWAHRLHVEVPYFNLHFLDCIKAAKERTERVTKVAATLSAVDLATRKIASEVEGLDAVVDAAFRNRLSKAGPAGSAVELVGGGVQRVGAGFAVEGSRGILLVQRACEWWLSATLGKHTIARLVEHLRKVIFAPL